MKPCVYLLDLGEEILIALPRRYLPARMCLPMGMDSLLVSQSMKLSSSSDVIASSYSSTFFLSLTLRLPSLPRPPPLIEESELLWCCTPAVAASFLESIWSSGYSLNLVEEVACSFEPALEAEGVIVITLYAAGIFKVRGTSFIWAHISIWIWLLSKARFR